MNACISIFPTGRGGTKDLVRFELHYLGGQPLTSVFKSHPRLGYNYICISGGCAEDSLLGKDSVATTIPARRGGRRRGGRRRGAVLRELRRGYGFPRRARRPFELPKT